MSSRPQESTDAVGMLARLQPRKVLLLGDLLLDRYTYGRVGRISPEAPVPVLLVERKMQMPGGAGNVALNLSGLGNTVFLCTRVGNDMEGRELQHLLEEKGEGRIDVEGLVVQQGIHTPIKTRFIAASQQLLRVDQENPTSMDEPTRHALIAHAIKCLPLVDIVAVSDYGKGAIDRELLAPIFAEAKRRGVPVVVDPKSKDFSLYAGATLIKPNLKEALEASATSSSDLDVVAAGIFSKISDLQYLMITRSQDGVSLFERGGKHDNFPARVFEVIDVTGAGDCVLAALVHAMACKLPMPGCCHLANIAGALAIQKVGCVQLTLKDVARKMLRADAHNKVFDESHLFALQEACRGENVHMIQVEPADLERMEFLLAMHRYRHKNPQALIIVQVDHRNLSDESIQVLTEQSSIDLLMLLEHANPTELMQAQQLLRWKGGQLEPVVF